MAEKKFIEKIKEKMASKGSAQKEGKPAKEELKEKYGVMETIPEQEIEEEKVELERETPEPKEETIPDLVLKIERISGKLDAIEDFKRDTDERIALLSEEVGELRSVLLEKEKQMGKIESDAERAFAAVEELQPENIKKQLRKRDEELLELRADLEKIDAVVKELKEQNKELTGVLEKIKSFDNLVEMAKKIDKKLSKIDDTKSYADRMVAKVEMIFSELNDKLRDLENQKDRIQKLDELSVDMVKMLDELSIKLPKFVEKSEFDKFKEELAKTQPPGVSKPTDFEAKLGELQAKVLQLSNELARPRQVVAGGDILRLSQDVDKLKSITKSLVGTLTDKLNSIEKCSRTIQLKTELYFEFLATLSMLQYVSDTSKIRFYLDETRKLIAKMMESGVWDEERKKLLLETLSNLAQLWKSYGYTDIAEMYNRELQSYTQKQVSMS
jgi:chromosome segregation ATPase